MPRPPRAKVASRVAKPKVAPRKPEQKATTTRITRAQDVAAASKSFSDDSDGLVTLSKVTRSSRRTVRDHATEHVEEEQFTMTGALPTEDNVRVSLSKKRTPTSAGSKGARTSRGSDTLSAGKTSSPAVAPAQSPIANEHAHAAHASFDESSGFGDLTFSSLGSESPAHGTRPPSAIKVGATPAHERSILALTNFKRRARQPSLLRMVQQTTDIEDNDHNDLDNTDNFDFEDFLPHAESTPLNVRKTGPSEEFRNDSGTQVSSSGSRGTKRKLSPVVQVPRSSPPGSPAHDTESDIESTRSPSPSLPEVLPSQNEIIAQTQDDDEILSQTYAPPKSSSPIPEKVVKPESPAQTRPRRRGRPAKTPIIDHDDSDADDTETPAKAKRGAKKKVQQAISTAQLKGLLPRRRYRHLNRDEFDLDSSEEVTQLDSDQDELQMPTRRNRQRPGAGKLASPKASKKVVRGKKAAPAKAGPRLSRTYSRRISSDKENDTAEQGDQEATEVSAIEHSEKLAAIRKKFEEVDAFELEFETVDVTTSSSPFR
ncbi:hypothetical protein T440DRAFT_499032 [Plenodomus tracheiphilus IPT5]|uniref:Uncharacterized protein n=1 Tax=Plenodomus tracheiphilus IPT5 TaxID=1408161 RepID=A0A6A7B4V9_9PLEO|nr:hypothetical protein T440DRAFT_499032 [Plenodomus tracheiphilus IPT5]